MNLSMDSVSIGFFLQMNSGFPVFENLIKFSKKGKPEFIWRNNLILPESIERFIKSKSVGFFYSLRKLPDYKKAKWILNMCTDPDEYKHSLISLDDVFGANTPILNHPRSIFMSRRDLSARTLDGIENLIVPKCKYFLAEETRSFQKTFEKEGFEYPILIRPATSHTGEDLFKVDHPLDWQKVYRSNWYMKHHFMTQFIDFKQENKRYLKIRIAVIGENISLRAHGEDTQWRLGHPGIKEEEITTSEQWRNLVHQYDVFPSWESANRVGHEIRKRAKLDFFGIDLGVVDNNTFVLFEANASMRMAQMADFEPEDRKIAEKIFLNMERDLMDLFSQPHKWADGQSFPTCRNILGMT